MNENLSESTLLRELAIGLERMQIEVTDEQCAALAAYVGLLVKWNRVINLTAVRDPQEMVRRHILDSLAVHKYIGSDTLMPGYPVFHWLFSNLT